MLIFISLYTHTHVTPSTRLDRHSQTNQVRETLNFIQQACPIIILDKKHNVILIYFQGQNSQIYAERSYTI